MKLFKNKRFLSTIHRGLIVRSKTNYKRSNNVFVKFNENSVVLVNRRQCLFQIRFMVLMY